ncbi:MAG: B12-binding domain-containing radical SAM protein [Candidatus Riflebacteria bacterium]|nr:B12-binding domain-containing radical SAM protein [Candidatus Riflebacteria bacterium]
MTVALIEVGGHENIFGPTSLGVQSLKNVLIANRIETHCLSTEDPAVLLAPTSRGVAGFVSRHSERLRDIVGISCTSKYLPHAIFLARAVRSGSGGFVILGGAGPTSAAREIIESFPFIDAVCVGEGEATLLEIVEKQRVLPGDLPSVAGLAIRGGSNDAVFTRPRPLIEDLDRLPVACNSRVIRNGESGELELLIQLNASRGCPGNCSFCANKVMWGHSTRAMSSVSLCRFLAEMTSRHPGHVPKVFFSDDTFVFPRARIASFARASRDHGLSVRWTAFARVADLDRSVIDLMGQSGCETITLGIEHTVSSITGLINKPSRRSRIQDTVHRCIGAGIVVRINLIWGWPTETCEDFRRLIEYAFELRRLGALVERISKLVVYPRTPLHARVRDSLRLDAHQTRLISSRLAEAGEIVLQRPDAFPNYLFQGFDVEHDEKVDHVTRSGLCLDSSENIRFQGC